MRVTDIGLWANGEEVADFSYEDPMSLNPYMMRAVIGLDADNLKPGFYGFGAGSGKKYYSVAAPPKDIVMRIVLNPNSELRMTFSQLRDNLYRAIAATRGAGVTVRFSAGASVLAQVEGHITKFEVPINSRTPELQITIHCKDPILRAPNSVYLEGPDLSSTNPIDITDGLSTAPHGFEMGVTFTAAEPEFVLRDPDGEWAFTVVYDFEIGDTLDISSIAADKAVKVTRSAVVTYLGGNIKPDSLWPVVFPGQNEFTIEELASVDIDYVQFYPAYWGV